MPTAAPALSASASHRDSLLGAAAAALAGGFALYTVARALELAESFVRPYPGGLQRAAGLQVLSAVVATCALALAARAFLKAPARRAARLGVAMTTLAVSFLAGTIGFATTAHFFASRRFAPRWAEAAFTTQAAGAFLLTLAFAVVAAGFLSSGAEPAAFKRRERLLGWGCVGLAIALAVVTAGTILLASMYSDLATSGYVAGVRTIAAGDAIAIAAALVAAGAFLVSRHGGKRDVRLGVASAVAFGAFLVGGAGYLVAAWAMPSNSVDGTLLAAAWISAVGTLGFALAFLCAAAGLWPPTPRL